MGEKVGVKSAAIHKYECGVVDSLLAERLFRLGTELKTTPEYLYGITDEADVAITNKHYMMLDDWLHINPDKTMDESVPKMMESETFSRYQKEIDSATEEIVQYMYMLCHSVPYNNGELIDSETDREMSEQDKLMEKMIRSRGAITTHRLNALLELLNNLEPIVKLKIRLADELNVAEY